MPLPRLTSTYNASINDISILTRYIADSSQLDSRYQYMISEVVMLRLFSILEFSIADIACKLACGALYRDGTNPLVLHPCHNISHASAQMLSFGRGRNPLRFLQWTKADLIEKSIRNVLDINDNFNRYVQLNAALINEMRIVRNHVAHKTASTRNDYYQLLSTIYSLNPRINIGPYLTSTTRHARSNINKYLLSVPIILNDLTKGL